MEAEDALYELPPEEFVAARDALARELRAAGDADGARRVKGLRRPTVAAWAVNLAVRRAPQGVEGLLELRGELQRAQRRLLSGRRATDLSALTRQRRQQVDALVADAEAALQAHGRDLGGHAEDVRATFEAVLGGDDAAHRVQQARLERPLPAPAGFGTLAGLSAVPDGEEGGEPAPGQSDARPTAPPATDARGARLAEARERRAAAEASADAALARAREAEGEAARLREEASTAADDARRSRREAEAAVSRAERAEAAHRRAQDAADTAEALAGRARDHADTALQEAEEAQRAVTALLGGT